MKKYIFTTDYVLGNIKIKKGQILDGVEVKGGTLAKQTTFVEFVNPKFKILTQSTVAKVQKPPFDIYVAPKDAVPSQTESKDAVTINSTTTDTKVADVDDKIFGIKKTYFYIGVALLLVGGYFGYQKYIAKK
jgi:hypothetical protein